jgi:hypothetical protein
MRVPTTHKFINNVTISTGPDGVEINGGANVTMNSNYALLQTGLFQGTNDVALSAEARPGDCSGEAENNYGDDTANNHNGCYFASNCCVTQSGNVCGTAADSVLVS